MPTLFATLRHATLYAATLLRHAIHLIIFFSDIADAFATRCSPRRCIARHVGMLFADAAAMPLIARQPPLLMLLFATIFDCRHVMPMILRCLRHCCRFITPHMIRFAAAAFRRCRHIRRLCADTHTSSIRARYVEMMLRAMRQRLCARCRCVEVRASARLRYRHRAPSCA